jgi:hypothetical protein
MTVDTENMKMKIWEKGRWYGTGAPELVQIEQRQMEKAF